MVSLEQIGFCFFLFLCLDWITPSQAFVPPVSVPPIQQRYAPAPTLCSSSLSGEEIFQKLQDQLAKLRQRDRRSKVLSQEDLKVVYEDDHIVVVDKPSGILCVPSEEGIPSLAQVVFERCRSTESSRNSDEPMVKTMDQMVVHRLGMDTSGLVVFTKTKEALRYMNTLFRTRRVTRQYEALVCGHVTKADNANDADGAFGWIPLPLMRDFECPPFMRVSTEENQNVLVGLDPDVVGKRLMEAPKQSITKYQIMAKEELKTSSSSSSGLPVTRLTLTAITGRTHQLNVHLAAFGHPIVGDRIYGFGGDALPNGGLDVSIIAEQNPKRATEDLQEQIAAVVEASNIDMCVHAKFLSFRHPVTQEDVSFSSQPPF